MADQAPEYEYQIRRAKRQLGFGVSGPARSCVRGGGCGGFWGQPELCLKTVGEAVLRLAPAANPTEFGAKLKWVSAWGQAHLRVLGHRLVLCHRQK
jgi:hypothetical protein